MTLIDSLSASQQAELLLEPSNLSNVTLVREVFTKLTVSSSVEDLSSFFDKFVTGATEVSVAITFSVTFSLQWEVPVLQICAFFLLAKLDKHWSKCAWHHPKYDPIGTWPKTIHARRWRISAVVPSLPTSVPPKHWLKHIPKYSRKYQLQLLPRDVS